MIRQILFLTLSCSALTGCLFWKSNPMATGYKYHSTPFNSAPGPAADELGYAYSNEKNEEILQIWRLVAEDLVTILEEESKLTHNSFYINPEHDNTFDRTFDHVLREVLNERGYVATNNRNTPYEIRFDAQELDALQQWGEDEMLQDFDIALGLFERGALKTEAQGVYKLPHYGYAQDRAAFLKFIQRVPARTELKGDRFDH